MKYKIAIFLIICCFSNCYSQEDYNIDSLLENYLLSFRDNISNEFLSSDTFANRLIGKIEKYYNHKNRRTRLYAYRLTLEIGIRNQNKDVKAKVLENLLKASYDSDVAIKEYFSDIYHVFKKDHFSQKFIEELKKLIHDDLNVNRSHLLLAGMLNLEDEKQYIDNRFVTTGGKGLRNEFGLSYYNSIHFAANLALARMGEDNNINYVLEKVEEEHSDKIVRDLLDKIAYIKQPKAINFIVDYLYSDATFPPEFESEVGFNYALKAMIILENAIIGFPKQKIVYPPDKVIEISRNWMNEHRNNYEINRNTW